MSASEGRISIVEDDDIQILGENSPDIMFLKELKRGVCRLEMLSHTGVPSFDERCWTSNCFSCGAVQPRLHCCLHSSNFRRNAPEQRGPHMFPGNMVHPISSSAEEKSSSHKPCFILSNATSTNTQNIPQQPRVDCGIYHPCLTIYNDCGKKIALSLQPTTVNNDCGKKIELSLQSATVNNDCGKKIELSLQPATVNNDCGKKIQLSLQPTTVNNDCGKKIELSLQPTTVNNDRYQSHHSFGNNYNNNSAQLVLQLAASGSSGCQSTDEINSSSNSVWPSTGESSPPCHSSSACLADPSPGLPSLNSNFGLNVPSGLSEIRRSRNMPPSSTFLKSKCNRCRKRKPARKQKPNSSEKPYNVMALLENLSKAPTYQENSLSSTSKRMQVLLLCLKLAGAKPKHVHLAGNFVETERALYGEVTDRTRISKLKAHLRRYGVRESYMKCFIMYIKNEMQ